MDYLSHIFDVLRQFNSQKYIIKLGAEVEFYFNHEKFLNFNKLNLNIEDDIYEFISKNIPIKYFQNIVKEKGKNQYEMQFSYTSNISELLIEIDDIRSLLEKNFADFSAKPFLNDYGSALHWHISIYNEKNINLFANNEINENYLLLYSIGGLCQNMKKDLQYFIASPKDLKRFTPGFDAPVNISWGGNNRTVAIRIPVSGNSRRIEHRVSSANCNLYKSLYKVLFAIFEGIKNEILPPERIYGIAYDSVYKLEKLISE